MKIAFFCIPAQGHTNPTLGVVRELVRRGHEVRYYSYESMRKRIEESGAQFVSCDAFEPQRAPRPEDSARIGRDLFFSVQLIVEMTLAMDETLLADMKAYGPDVIVGDSMAFWAKLIAGKLEVPFVSSTTTFAFNRASAGEMKQSGREALKLLFSIPRINGCLRPLRKKGYPVRSFLDIISNSDDTDTIVYTSREFQPCADSFSARYAFVGPVLRPAAEILEKEDRPTVFISLGSVDTLHPNFYKNAIAAFSDGTYRVIMSVGESTDRAALGAVPENVSLAGSVDQMAVLKVTDVFLTHCGMNSTSEALYYGIPLVLFPQTPEQTAVANRVRELGAGCFLEENAPAAIRAAVDAVRTDPHFRDAAGEIAKSFHACGGAAAAADKVEAAALKG